MRNEARLVVFDDRKDGDAGVVVLVELLVSEHQEEKKSWTGVEIRGFLNTLMSAFVLPLVLSSGGTMPNDFR